MFTASRPCCWCRTYLHWRSSGVLGFNMRFQCGFAARCTRMCRPATRPRRRTARDSVRARLGCAEPRSCYLYVYISHALDDLFICYKDRSITIVAVPRRPWGLRQFDILDCNGYVLYHRGEGDRWLTWCCSSQSSFLASATLRRMLRQEHQDVGVKAGPGTVLGGNSARRVLTGTDAEGKRQAPKEVVPVVANGVRYTAPHFGALRGRSQNSRLRRGGGCKDRKDRLKIK